MNTFGTFTVEQQHDGPASLIEGACLGGHGSSSPYYPSLEVKKYIIIPPGVPFSILQPMTDVVSAQEPLRRSTHAQLHLLDPRSSAWGSRPCCCSKPTSAWWRDRTASLCNPLEARLGRCVEISTTPRKQITVDPYEGRHETSGHHSCRECSLADVDGEGIQQCPMGASCLWHLCQVTSSSGPPTLLLHTHNWRMGKLRAGSAHWNDTEPSGTHGTAF